MNHSSAMSSISRQTNCSFGSAGTSARPSPSRPSRNGVESFVQLPSGVRITGITCALTFGITRPRSSAVIPVQVCGKRFARSAARTLSE